MADTGQTRFTVTNPHTVPVTVKLERSAPNAGVWALVETWLAVPPGESVYFVDTPCGETYDYRALCYEATWGAGTDSAYSATVEDQAATQGCT